MSAGANILTALRLTGRLWLRFWPQLMLLVALGGLVEHLFLELAVALGFIDPAVGFSGLTLVVLARVTVIVLMFHLMRPALPALEAVTAGFAEAAGRPDGTGGGEAVRKDVSAGSSAEGAAASPIATLSRVLTVTLIPFFGFYAAWGFLQETVRDYSIMGLQRWNPFEGIGFDLLDYLDARWLVLSVGLTWILRRAFKAMQARSGSAFWTPLIVTCEANWLLTGAQAVKMWYGTVWQWILDSGDFLRQSWAGLPAPASVSFAATIPVEALPPSVREVAVGLFWYALLPLVWLVMAALIYGYDVPEWTRDRLVRRLHERYAKWPVLVRNFLAHFTAGWRTRILPVIHGLRLALGAELVLLLLLVVGWRAIGWSGLWLWIGLTRWIGPHPLDFWNAIVGALAQLVGGPSGFGGGVLIEPLKFCLIAAVLETAATLRRARQAEVASPAG